MPAYVVRRDGEETADFLPFARDFFCINFISNAGTPRVGHACFPVSCRGTSFVLELTEIRNPQLGHTPVNCPLAESRFVSGADVFERLRTTGFRVWGLESVLDSFVKIFGGLFDPRQGRPFLASCLGIVVRPVGVKTRRHLEHANRFLRNAFSFDKVPQLRILPDFCSELIT